ncbi:MAG: hypothetical protein J6V72_00710 [Kiritimatiellae bacterium]|nr:hypothetical protein [Kiritimatiellia bacterium]
MKAYTLRRDLLPDGVDLEAVDTMSQDEVEREMNRQQANLLMETGKKDSFIDIYSSQYELEDLINLDEGAFDPQKYYLRIFLD